MDTDEDSRSWTQKALALIGGAAVVAFTAIAGIYTFLMTMETPLYENSAGVPSVSDAAPSP